MEREIKFRAWDSKNLFMFYHDDEGNFERKIDGCRVGSDFDVQELIFNPYDCLKIMQFTGLQTKQKQEIYEGDIVYIAGEGNCLVKFPYYDLYERIFSGDSSDIEKVIGNIYENPDLLTI
jgi:uncharacterized phage protein (TIGR01671 family)